MNFSQFLDNHNAGQPLRFLRGNGRAFATCKDGTKIFVSSTFDNTLSSDTRWVVESDGSQGACPAGTYFLTNSSLEDAFGEALS